MILRDAILAKRIGEARLERRREIIEGELIEVGGWVQVSANDDTVVWVRGWDESGGVFQSLNLTVKPLNHLPVLVARDPNVEYGHEIISINKAVLARLDDKGILPAFNVPNHHETHEWPDWPGTVGPDPLTVYPRSFGPGRVYVGPDDEGLEVSIAPFRYAVNGQLLFFRGTRRYDLAAHQPGSGEARLLLVGVSTEDGAVSVTAGETGPDDDLTLPPFAAAAPAGVIGLCYVRLDGDQSRLVERDFVVDLRLLPGGGGTQSAGGAEHGLAWVESELEYGLTRLALDIEAVQTGLSGALTLTTLATGLGRVESELGYSITRLALLLQTLNLVKNSQYDNVPAYLFDSLQAGNNIALSQVMLSPGNEGTRLDVTGVATTNSQDTVKVSMLYESDFGAAAWQTNAAGDLLGQAGVDVRPNSDAYGLWTRLVNKSLSPVEHYSNGAENAAWTGWASYTGFATPGTQQFTQSSFGFSHSSTARKFRYRAYLNQQAIIYCRVAADPGQLAGVMVDDGVGNADGLGANNFVRWMIEVPTSGNWNYAVERRTGGGAVTKTTYCSLPPAEFYTLALLYGNGTRWTNWGAYWYVKGESSVFAFNNQGSVTGQTWTPARIGIYSGPGADLRGIFDWYHET